MKRGLDIRAFIAGTILVAAPISASSQPVSGLYFSGGAGVGVLTNEDAQLTSRLGDTGWIYPPEAGSAFDLAAGYGFSNGIRIEVEGNYHYTTFSYTDVGGQEQKYGTMANVLYEFASLGPTVQPYVGLGAGWQWVKESNLYASAGRLVAHDASATQGTIAYQGIAGIAFPIASLPGLALVADYRLMRAPDNRDYDAAITGLRAPVPANLRLSNELEHTFLVGFRYALGAEPPVPPVAAHDEPVPPAATTRSYLVFFDWDKADLTDRARQIVADAAANTKKAAHTSLEVNGYTDTSGTPAYNQALSLRRAHTVAGELVKDGVAGSDIAIHAFGETHLLVQTGPDVREPQNRRVEIIIR
jgi:outer membrane protein OmpA-like peptidoglycan-associated protein